MANSIGTNVVIIDHTESSLGERRLDQVLGSLGIVSSLSDELGTDIIRNLVLRNVLGHGRKLESFQVEATLAQWRRVRSPSAGMSTSEAGEADEEERVRETHLDELHCSEVLS